MIIAAALSVHCQNYPSSKRGPGVRAKPDFREDAMSTSASIIPRPLRISSSRGAFEINANTTVAAEGNGSAGAARMLAATLAGITGFAIVESPSPGKGSITLKLEKKHGERGIESYSLSVSGDRVVVHAGHPAGLFRGTQTIRQLAMAARHRDLTGAISIPCMEIHDAPRFAWRGLNLDCSRHFPPKDYVKRCIDLMALYKLNVLHLHLTDDQGWRIEINKYPKLTKIGAWRKTEGGGRYGGFYTREDIRDIVAYARERHIMVVPEIEMPGHCQAALAAYPGLSCTGKAFDVSRRWGIHKEIYCAGKEDTFRFLEDVLEEVMELFPSPYIHVGGDECLKPRWKRCPHCQARIAREKLTDENGLQSYFIKRMEKFVSGRGRKLIGWDEILEGGLVPGATVQSWRGFNGAVAAAKSAHDTIVSPTSHTYFDYGLTYTNLAKVYSFEPVPNTLTEIEARHVLGSEACMWTEFTPPEKIDSMLYPRIIALSEVLWSPAGERDFAGFRARLGIHYPLLRSLGVSYGAEDEPVYARVRYHFRMAKIFLSILREDPEAAMENLRRHNTD